MRNNITKLYIIFTELEDGIKKLERRMHNPDDADDLEKIKMILDYYNDTIIKTWRKTQSKYKILQSYDVQKLHTKRHNISKNEQMPHFERVAWSFFIDFQLKNIKESIYVI
jgi:hypothetical protein